MRFQSLLITVCLSFASIVLEAQTVNNPTLVTFNSPDHAAVEVTAYELEIKTCNNPPTCTSVTSVQTIQINKSLVTVADATANPIVYQASINVQPVKFGTYVGIMRTIAGTLKSDDAAPSNSFNRIPGPPGKVTIK